MMLSRAKWSHAAARDRRGSQGREASTRACPGWQASCARPWRLAIWWGGRPRLRRVFQTRPAPALAC